MTKSELPPEITNGATLRGNEYGWTVSAFPDAVKAAAADGYTCLGGQFQFRLADGSTCEMYWISADSKDRLDVESWEQNSHRSCTEVLEEFRQRLAEADFGREAARWPFPINPADDLVFVAYFVTETEWKELSTQGTS